MQERATSAEEFPNVIRLQISKPYFISPPSLPSISNLVGRTFDLMLRPNANQNFSPEIHSLFLFLIPHLSTHALSHTLTCMDRDFFLSLSLSFSLSHTHTLSLSLSHTHMLSRIQFFYSASYDALIKVALSRSFSFPLCSLIVKRVTSG